MDQKLSQAALSKWWTVKKTKQLLFIQMRQILCLEANVDILYYGF